MGRSHGWCDRAALVAVRGTGVLFVAYVSFVLLWSGSDTVRAFVGDLAYVPVGLVFTLLGVRVVVSGDLDPRSRRAWAVITAALFCQFVAHLSWFVEDAVLGDPPYPAFADYWFLASPMVMLVGLVMLPGAHRSGAERVKLALDTLIVGLSVLMVLWYLVLGDLIYQRGATVTEVVYSAALPLADGLLVLALARMVLGRAVAADSSVRALSAALVAYVIADVYYGYVQLHEGFVGGSWPDLLWFLGCCLFVVAAHRRYELGRVDRRGAPVPPRRAAASWLPYLAIALAFALLTKAVGRQALTPLGGMVLGAVLLTAIVVVRQMYALRENRELAVTDALTGLANRGRLGEILSGLPGQPLRDGRHTAIMVIDLDRFKPINDRYGHEAGDAVLSAVATALRSVLRTGDTAGRLGGDEFAVVLQSLPGPEAAERIAQRLVEALRTPVVIGELVLGVEASIGVALREEGALDGDTLLSRADLAMYAAKRAGRGRYQVYTPELDTGARDAELRRAVANDELVVHFQPAVDLPGGGIVAVEALVRWQHPERGLLMPGAFIDLAEETGAIVAVGEWVLREACREVATWRAAIAGADRLLLSVNLSPHQVVQPNLVERIEAVLAETGFPADRLILELTEGVVLEPDPQTVDRLEQLRRLGILIAVDDFGTGYSALRYLRLLPVDILKIDRSFVTGIADDEDLRTVAEAVVRLGMAFRMAVVAEGIETAQEARILDDLGCRFGQGYHFYRPLPAPAAADAVREAVGSGTR